MTLELVNITKHSQQGHMVEGWLVRAAADREYTAHSIEIPTFQNLVRSISKFISLKNLNWSSFGPSCVKAASPPYIYFWDKFYLIRNSAPLKIRAEHSFWCVLLRASSTDIIISGMMVLGFLYVYFIFKNHI